MRVSLRAAAGAVLFFCLLMAVPDWAASPQPGAASLNQESREIFATSMAWGDRYWDPQAKLCRDPQPDLADDGRVRPFFMVRESAWYALGLLMRDGPGDRDRAVEILQVVLEQQYHEPGRPWDGTFRRTPSEPEPGPNAVMWRGYDPNWREFIGTTFALILEEYRDRIPAAMARAMTASIDAAVAGEIKQGRLAPTYTNPALMLGFLWSYAAGDGGRPEWAGPAAKWVETEYRLFKQHDAFYEFNSPTYAGVDFYALALWRDYGQTARMRAMGSEMEAALWRTTAQLYNARLRNISGPYDRSYGMDMRSYVSVTGLWLRTELDADEAPLPRFDAGLVDHADDLWFVPPIVALGTRIPADAMRSFEHFGGEHEVRQPIAEGRIATAWIGKDLIYGGEITGHTRGVDAASQFHPVTVQWQAPGRVGWIQLTRCPPIDADADRKGITITAQGDVSFRMFAPGIAAAEVTAGEWKLPGLTVRVKADEKSFSVQQHGDSLYVKYAGMTEMHLEMARTGE